MGGTADILQIYVPSTRGFCKATVFQNIIITLEIFIMVKTNPFINNAGMKSAFSIYHYE